MKWKSNVKRFLVMLLVLTMTAGLLPANVLAASGGADQILPGYGSNSGLEKPVDLEILNNPELQATGDPVDAAVIFSDLHTTENNYKEGIITDIFGALKTAGLPISSVTSAGDAFSVDKDETAYTGETATITGYIQDVLDTDVSVNYVWADRDRYGKDIAAPSGFVYGAGADGLYGTDDDGNYYVYELSMADTGTWDRYEAGFYTEDVVKEHIQRFKNNASILDHTKPLFIVAHQPLLDRRNDNGHAYKWAQAINEVAGIMDVAYFFGHNHGYDEAGDYYYAKGTTMPVATTVDLDSTDEGIDLEAENVVLSFPHICAGYMDPDPDTTSETTRTGTVMAITIYDDSIQYTTYNKDGVYTGDNALNVEVEREHEASTAPLGTATDDATGITVTGPGITGVTVETIADPAYDTTVFECYHSYRITPVGYTNGKVTVTIPVDEHHDENKPLAILCNDVAITAAVITGNTVTFTAGTFPAVYTVSETVQDLVWSEAHHQHAGEVYYELVTHEAGLVSGASYLIANKAQTTSNDDTNAIYVLKPDGSRDQTTYEDGRIVSDESANEWVITTSGNGYTIQNGDTYVYPDASRSGYWWTYSMVTDDTAQTVSISNGTSNGYLITRSVSANNRTTTSGLRYTNNVFGARQNGDNLWLFKKVTVEAEEVYSAISGKSTFTYMMYTYTAEQIKEQIADRIYVFTASDEEGNNLQWVSDFVLEGSIDVSTAGTYPLSIMYNGHKLGEITVKIEMPEIIGYSVFPDNGAVVVGAKGSDLVGAHLILEVAGNADSPYIYIPITLDMLRTADGAEISTEEDASLTDLQILLNGNAIPGLTFDLEIWEKNVNNYPEYPDEGAVTVHKTGTGIDFQSTGIAQVEISASGVPVKKGADVIVMLDTSSSMVNNYVLDDNNNNTGKTRAQVLEESLADLITYFRTPGDDGEVMDIRVAIADFNGYFGHNAYGISGSPYDRAEGDYVRTNSGGTGSSYAQSSEATVYTNTTHALDATAFVPVEDLADSYTLNYSSGTNYDYAFDAIYQLGTAIKKANEEANEERDLYVIFMSDGAPWQWNYYGAQSSYQKWNNWITGTWDADDLTASNLNSTTHSYFYDLVDHDGDGQLNEHRMANAIKGDPNERYEVIRKSEAGLPEGTLQSAGKDYLYTVPGLGATMFTINFDGQADNNILEASIDKSLASIASDQTTAVQYYYKVHNAELLDNAFHSISSEINYAATNARFVDQLGDDFNLQVELRTYEALKLDENGEPVDENGDGEYETVEKTITPVIEVLSYDIYTKADADAGLIPSEKKVGDRKGTYTLSEVVKFSDDGKKAYSNLIDVDKDGVYGVSVTKDASGNNVYTIADADDNILHTNQVIYAKTFLYNFAITSVSIDGVDIPTGVNKNNTTNGTSTELLSETFYWKLGTVQSSELAMRYYVYLEGSMEGTAVGGTYPTNEFAILYYDNYLGNGCYLETNSPVMPWKEASVSYAFYLVNSEGKVVVNQDTGEVGTFAHKIAVTHPVLHGTVLLNSDSAVNICVAARGVVPEGYRLYDPTAQYDVSVTSNGFDSNWTITGTTATTYVMNFDSGNASAYSNTQNMGNDSYDYTHTVVWFAVVWETEALPDTVVIDYGVPVDISVLANDMFGAYGHLAGVGPNSEGLNLDGHDAEMAAGFGNTYTGTYGTAVIHPENSKVCYKLNSMVMDKYEKFAYAVYYHGPVGQTGYYYDTITVIPATNIYFEDNFLTYSSYERASTTTTEWTETTSQWTNEGREISTDDITKYPHQGEDRPGVYSLTDANNIYGYDGVNNHMTTYSLGSAKKVTVNNLNRAEADFSFWGTGFDVISMTSPMTGNVKVGVEKYNSQTGEWEWFDGYTVDTYYGYKQADCHVSYAYTKVGDGFEWVRRSVLHEAAGCTTCTVETALPESGEAGDVVVVTENDWVVDQNFGMKQVPGDADGNGTVDDGELIWAADPDAKDCIYQVPVIKMVDKDYGHYRVNIKVTYNERFDHVEGSESYDFYLDAIRIYDPANDGASDGSTDTTIEDAYIADNEYKPTYYELRNLLLKAGSFGDHKVDSDQDGDIDDDDTTLEGLVFIDGDESVGSAAIADYESYGPNNEVYLAPGQRVAFLLSDPDTIDKVHIGIKSADGEQGYYTITNVAQAERENGRVKVGDYYNPRTYSMATTTDMYYDLTGWKDDIIVISNTGNRYGTDGIISITNIKITQKPVQTASETGNEPQNLTTPYIYMTAAAAELTVNALNKMGQQDAVSREPEIFAPELFNVKLNKTEVTVGQKVLVQVTTSADVECVSINGVQVSTYTTGSTGNRTWKLMVEAARTGELQIQVVCYNEFYTASEAKTQTVTVVAKGLVGWVSDLFT